MVGLNAVVVLAGRSDATAGQQINGDVPFESAVLDCASLVGAAEAVIDISTDASPDAFDGSADVQINIPRLAVVADADAAGVAVDIQSFAPCTFFCVSCVSEGFMPHGNVSQRSQRNVTVKLDPRINEDAAAAGAWRVAGLGVLGIAQGAVS